MVPKTTQGQLQGHEIKSTFHQPTGDEELTYSLDTGCMGTLTVTIGATQYVYKLVDIVGRVEVAL
ncbi:hypothetical protein SAMN05216600_1145 [Pseudomonas cuatrocienegasensis]|uniref:Uncharacterized protein n=1 Tax=Pseudomonas cuatrocienegasensis TaxID=543360 RepID=A0ABY1BKA2_9PSED|nr:MULTISPECIES: hypothetical protein [Pseudomonas]OEC34869.1 hypothetical protein A7D25_12260 [Pseudomonas sp. 21C1]SER04337.1 hypothetical protein SAMN05216600_1145 [Pseudomonas cuatrocienegasensis]